MSATLQIDNASFSNLMIGVRRGATMQASDISGMMLDKSYFADVIGTYMTYDIQVAVPVGEEGLYTTLYETITSPIGYHAVTVPYNQGILNITGRIESVSDTFFRTEGTATIWHQISFTIISNYPTKTQTLGQVVSYGMQTEPDVNDPDEGAIYMYSSGSWVPLEYTDGDEVEY